jgi:starch phosphorylase
MTITPRTCLHELALNLWWTWTPDVVDVFRAIDSPGWRETNHNPVALLAGLSPEEIDRRIEERSLESRIRFQYHRLEEYLAEPATCARRLPGAVQATEIAYFSAEFGLHESLPLYSGGLGVLAGDYLKSASDRGLPVVGVGLCYANGYFRQHLDDQGYQREEYSTLPLELLPVTRAAAADGSALRVTVDCGAGPLIVEVWVAHVGRTRLVLLDTDVADNGPDLRQLTARLYGGDETTRIRQEIVLGIAGLRALAGMGIRPNVLHLNEGHSAFVLLERMRERIEEDGLTFEAARRETARQAVFTTHTPVEAGHDRFAPDLVERELGAMRSALGVETDRLLALGRVEPGDRSERFCMTVLGLRACDHRNAVSHLHGHVAREMWHGVWPDRPATEVPIGHVTNGVHARSWLAPSMGRLYDRILGPDWVDRQHLPETWRSIAALDPDELWEAHVALRRKLVEFVRRRSGEGGLLDPEALTIGFARRFATYKRATLLVSDRRRLAALLADRARPVQFVFAGKAHPRDEAGKALIREVVALSRAPECRGRLTFVEDYDINVGRHLVQGVDVWLNTPLRPLEACGTSGQKVLLNGGLNVSTLDGWWAEAWDGTNGFAIGSSRVHADYGTQWHRDAAALYDCLEREVVPLFWDCDRSGVPQAWVARMKRSIATLAWRYSGSRMVDDYARDYYAPAAGGTTSARAATSR